MTTTRTARRLTDSGVIVVAGELNALGAPRYSVTLNVPGFNPKPQGRRLNAVQAAMILHGLLPAATVESLLSDATPTI